MNNATYLPAAFVLVTCFLAVILGFWKINDYLEQNRRLPSVSELWRYTVRSEVRAYGVVRLITIACTAIAALAVATTRNLALPLPARDLLSLVVFGFGCLWLIVRRASLMEASEDGATPTVKELFAASRRRDHRKPMRVAQLTIGLIFAISILALFAVVSFQLGEL